MANSAMATPATGTRAESGQKTTWVIDAAHSNVGFSIKHLMIATVRGSFTQAQGAVTVDESDPTTAEIDITIPTASVTTVAARSGTHTSARRTSSTPSGFRT
jgi:polyisoprenoid-binding protein YceI